MSAVGRPSEIVSFIWGVADLLSGDFKAHEFGQIILPFTVLRRLECALDPTKAQVVARAEGLVGKVDNVDPILQRTAGQRFYNTSPLDLTKVLADPGNAAKNLSTYVASSPRAPRRCWSGTGSRTRSPAWTRPDCCTKSSLSSRTST